MVQKIVLRNEVIKVKGRVKVITVKKEDFFKVLKLMKLRVLDKEYEALMPPMNSLQKNTIDVNGLATIIQQYMAIELFKQGNVNQTSPAQIVFTTSGGNITLSYMNGINPNSQGVTVYMQIFQESGNYTFQYYYVGFDTTNSSYSVSGLELYVSAQIADPNIGFPVYYTNLTRIAYASSSFTKTSDSYLFIVWLIEFQNIPPYLVPFTPLLQNNTGTRAGTSSQYQVYFDNSNCDLSCSGNCPSANLSGFIVSVKNNSVILEFSVGAPLNAGLSTLNVLLCTSMIYNEIPTISGSIGATLTPSISGDTFYVAIISITITYQGS